MTYVKVNGVLYPAAINGTFKDNMWDGRATKTIELDLTAEEAKVLFVDDTRWSIVDEYLNENEELVQDEYDNSEYCLAGDVVDHRNGTSSVTMGKLLDRELIEIMTGGMI